MTNKTRGKDGSYHINVKGKKKTFKHLRGSRAQVFNGNAFQTTGGLTKNKLKKNKSGRIVSVNKSKKAGKEKQLQKLGYITKKGVFGAHKNGKLLVKKSNKKRK